MGNPADLLGWGDHTAVLPFDECAALATTSWVFVTFGESHLEALYLTDDIARDPPPEIHFIHVFPSKMVNFYPPTHVYDLTGDRLTKSDEDPTSFTSVGHEADLDLSLSGHRVCVLTVTSGGAQNAAGRSVVKGSVQD
jgi:hypothetical protein